jgi:hypothetical protein
LSAPVKVSLVVSNVSGSPSVSTTMI